MTTLLTIRPNLILEYEAALSWMRAEFDRGRPLDVNRSTVPREVQMPLYIAYYNYKYNNGPWAVLALHPDSSWHCLPRARAVDTDDDVWLRNNPQYGWRFVVISERWHAQYYPELDTQRYRGNVSNNAVTTIEVKEEDDMPIFSEGANGARIITWPNGYSNTYDPNVFEVCRWVARGQTNEQWMIDMFVGQSWAAASFMAKWSAGLVKEDPKPVKLAPEEATKIADKIADYLKTIVNVEADGK